MPLRRPWRRRMALKPFFSNRNVQWHHVSTSPSLCSLNSIRLIKEEMSERTKQIRSKPALCRMCPSEYTLFLEHLSKKCLREIFSLLDTKSTMANVSVERIPICRTQDFQ